MKWKLSVGVSSSACRSLNSPYITALVTVTDPSGALLTKSFEMTIGEFKVIYRKVQEVLSCPFTLLSTLLHLIVISVLFLLTFDQPYRSRELSYL